MPTKEAMLSKSPTPAKAASRIRSAEAALAQAIVERDALLRALADQGATRRALAEQFGISVGRVQQIIDPAAFQASKAKRKAA
jgi:hypothetical protein